MGKNVYESPQCTTLKVELRNNVLGTSNEDYGVNDYGGMFDDDEG